MLVLAFATLCTLVFARPAGAGDSPPAPAAALEARAEDVRTLLERHRPVIKIRTQEKPCSNDGEAFRPISPNDVLDDRQIALRQVGAYDPVAQWGPSPAAVAGLNGGFYLDFPGNALQPGCIYESDSEQLEAGKDPVVLGRVVKQADQPDHLVVQYWIYWYYNDWNNKHESDWEGIQLVFDATTVAEALTRTPTATGYAQHDGGESAAWTDDKVGKDGDRPVVYSSRGSHASYYGSSLFLGRSASEGFGCDNTDEPSTRLDPVVEVLPTRAIDAEGSTMWLTFRGQWGELGEGPNNGPTGPTTKMRWDRPIDWQDTLRSESFIVPAGDSSSEQLVATFCRISAWGSNQLISFQYSPVKLLVVLGLLAIAGRLLIGATGWSACPPLPVLRRRRIGQVLRGGPALFRHHPLEFGLLALVALPVGLLTALAGTVVGHLPFVGALVLTDNGSRPDLATATILSTLATLVSVSLISGTVAHLLRNRTGRIGPLSESLRTVLRRLPELLMTAVPAIVLVIALSFTVIGLPLALWLTVRWSFLSQTVVLDGLRGIPALRASSKLVRGRWFQTAAVVGTVTLVMQTVGVVVSLLALVAFTGMPLWLLAGLGTFVQLLLVPLCSIVLCLLHGDAVANEREHLTGDGPGSVGTTTSTPAAPVA